MTQTAQKYEEQSGMTDVQGIFAEMWNRYATAVNANDADQYAELFTEDAIRMLPGTDLERGREAIRRGEQADYEAGHWHISPKPLDAIQAGDDWIYGIAEVQAKITAHSDGAVILKTITAAWLLHRQPDGEWLIARHILNVRAITE